MNTTKALANGQKQLLGVVRGMMGTMRLAAMAAEGLQRAMEAADRKAAERTQRSLEAAERAVGGLIVPLDDAARGLKALAGAMDAAGKRAAGFMQAGATVRIATTIPMPVAGGAAAGPAEEAAALSERAQLEEKIKSKVIPDFTDLVGKTLKAVPDLRPKQKSVQESIADLQKVVEQQIPLLTEMKGYLSKTAGSVLGQFNGAAGIQYPQQLDSGAAHRTNESAEAANMNGDVTDSAVSAAPKAAGTSLPPIDESIATIQKNLTSLMTENEAVVGFIADNWSTLGQVYEGVNTALNVYNTLQMVSQTYSAIAAISVRVLTIATTGLKNTWAGLNATMKANVIIAIISLIAGLVAAIIALWKNNDSFAFFFVKAWYSILEFFYRIPVYFWTVAEAIMLVFVLLANKLGETFDNIINGLIEKINKALDVFNKIAGTDWHIPLELNTKDLANAALEFIQDKKADALENAEKKAAEFAEKEQKFIEDRKAQREAEEEAKKLADAENLLQGSGMDSPGPAIRQDAVVSVGGGRIDEVGSVNDTVDISSEDLKTMRELAEMKNIQNFVTLQPSVNVQTGDIRNGMDVSSMVQAITSVLQEEIASSAQGVYE